MTETQETTSSALAAALAEVQKALPKIRKTETGRVSGKTKDGDPFSYEYRYADLADVTDEIMPLLGKNGLAFTAAPRIVDGRFVLLCELLHESGEQKIGEWPLPANGSPQQLGSAMTYGRRYTLCAMTGVAPGGDDDDAGAAQRSYDYQAQRPPAAEQAPAATPKDQAVTQLRTLVRSKGLGENSVPAAFERRMGKPIVQATADEVQDYTAFVRQHSRLDDAPDETTPATEPGDEAVSAGGEGHSG
jgi:hypothetical protein